MNSYETQDYIFDIANNVMFTLLFVSYIGVWSLAPDYLEMLRMGVQLYVSLFLIVRFNPYVKRVKFSELDRKVAYSAGIFMFMSTIIAKYFTYMVSLTTPLDPKDAATIVQHIS
jgi:hypothetical protein